MARMQGSGRARRLAAAAGLVVAVLLTGSMPLAANGAQPTPTEEPSLASERSIEEQYSEDFGVSRPEAAERLRQQATMLDLVAKIQASVPSEVLAGIWIDNGTEHRLVVDLVDGATSTAVEQLAAGVDVPVTVSATRPASLAELTSTVSKSTEAWVKEIGHLNGVGVDETTGHVVFYVDGSVVARGSVDPTQLTALPAEVVYDTSPGSDGRYGGLNLGSCTAGFTARNYLTGTKGFFTAAHCGTQSYQYPFSGGSWYSSSYQSQRYDGYADIQFRTFSSHTPQAKFYGSSTSTLTTQIQGGYAVTGSYLCHRGKTTGYRCGSVTSTTYAPTWSGACQSATCQPVWVRVNAYSQPGDSGGPWFISGNAAAGIHKGGATDGSWAVYAKLEYSPGSTTVCSSSACP